MSFYSKINPFYFNKRQVKRIDYDSFGNIISDSNPEFAVPFGFAGGLHDKDIGLVRFGFRDYDPDTGRWTAKDLIVLVNKNIDLYGYIQNDPINWIDPYGLFEWKTFGYGVLEISIGLVSFGVAYGVAFSTGGLGAAASVLVIYEGAFIFAVGLTDIIGAFYGEKPFGRR
ncbi:MAG: RHS repeat domain-containing protein [bacterium]